MTAPAARVPLPARGDALPPGPPPERGLLGLFDDEEAAAHAAAALKRSGFERLTAYSPMPPHEILDELEERPSVVRRFTLFGGLLGVVLGFAIAAYTGVAYRLPLIVAGRPPIDWPPYVIIMFEVMVLIGGLATFVGVLVNGRLPRAGMRLEFRPEFTANRFGVFVATTDADNARAVLARTQAVEIHEVGS